MIQPIAFSVLRQALLWHAFPVPEMRQLSFYEWPDYFQAEYLLTWPEHIIPQKYFVPSRWQFRDGLAAFWHDLEDCFASDVLVLDCTWHELDQQMTALLSVQLEKVPFQLAIGL